MFIVRIADRIFSLFKWPLMQAQLFNLWLLLVFAILISICPISSFAQPVTQIEPPQSANITTVGELIVALKKSGYNIVFSSDLLADSTPITIDRDQQSKISVLREFLAEKKLKLERQGALLLVVKEAATFEFVGKVIDAKGRAIANADVYSQDEGQAQQTDSNGYFALALEKGLSEYTLIVDAEYFQRRKLVRSHSNLQQLRVISLMAEQVLQEVIVTGSHHKLAKKDNVNPARYLSISQLESVPVVGDDASRVLTTLPGTSSMGITAKPFIRGGLQDEVLIQIDGVEILEAFHLSDFHSIFSSVDSRAIDSVALYTGGHPARYGSRMSGVIDYTPKVRPGNYAHELAVSGFTTSLGTQGHINAADIGWQFLYRQGNLDKLLDQVNDTIGTPKYSDSYGRIDVPLDGGSNGESQFHFSWLWSKDEIDLNVEDRIVSSDVNNRYFWASLDTQISKSHSNQTTLAFINVDKNKSAVASSSDSSEVSGTLDYQQETEKYVLRSDFSIDEPQKLIEYGGVIEWSESQYHSALNIDRGIFAPVIGEPQNTIRNINVSPDGWSADLYVSGEFNIYKSLWLQPGLRWSWQDYLSRSHSSRLSPRLGLKTNLATHTELNMLVGRYYQVQSTHELDVRDGLTTFFAPQSADHAIVGLTQKYKKVAFKLDTYYKKYRRQKDRFENLFNPFTITPVIEADRIRISPNNAKVYGVEIGARYKPDPDWTLNLDYAAMRSVEKLGRRTVSRRQQQRHTASLGVDWQTPTASVNASIKWHSGWRTTRLPSGVSRGETIDPQAIFNNDQTGSYLTLDIGVRRYWELDDMSLTLGIDVINALDKANVVGNEYEYVQNVDSIRFSREDESLSPLIPNITVRLQF